MALHSGRKIYQNITYHGGCSQRRNATLPERLQIVHLPPRCLRILPISQHVVQPFGALIGVSTQRMRELVRSNGWLDSRKLHVELVSDKSSGEVYIDCWSDSCLTAVSCTFEISTAKKLQEIYSLLL